MSGEKGPREARRVLVLPSVIAMISDLPKVPARTYRLRTVLNIKTSITMAQYILKPLR
jgi:hypothetical protein